MGIDRGSGLHVGNYEHVNRPSHRALPDLEEFGDVRVTFGNVFYIFYRLGIAVVIIKVYRNLLSSDSRTCSSDQQKKHPRDKKQTTNLKRLDFHQTFPPFSMI